MKNKHTPESPGCGIGPCNDSRPEKQAQNLPMRDLPPESSVCERSGTLAHAPGHRFYNRRQSGN